MRKIHVQLLQIGTGWNYQHKLCQTPLIHSKMRLWHCTRRDAERQDRNGHLRQSDLGKTTHSRESNLKLQKALEIRRSSEQTSLQPQQMDPNSDSAHYVKHKEGPGEPKMKQNCKYNEKDHPRGKCPAFGKACLKLSKVGHFLQVCKSAPGEKPSETGKVQLKKPTKAKGPSGHRLQQWW